MACKALNDIFQRLRSRRLQRAIRKDLDRVKGMIQGTNESDPTTQTKEAPEAMPDTSSTPRTADAFTEDDAIQFFDELAQYWIRVRDQEFPGLPDMSTSISEWRGDGPKGAVLHYTGGPSWKNAVKWFMQGGKASAHVVVCSQHIPGLYALTDGLPLVAALPVTVLQMVPPTKGAWHATWANPFCYGIENRNIGRALQAKKGAPWTYYLGKVPAELQGRITETGGGSWPKTGYERYSQAQVFTNVVILRYLHALHHLDRRLVLPHSAYQRQNRNGKLKYDTGRAYPIVAMREAVFNDTLLATIQRVWGAIEPEEYDDPEDDDATTLIAGTQADYRMLDPLFHCDDKRVMRGLEQVLDRVDENDDVPMVRFLLRFMGYDVEDTDSVVADGEVRKALWVFTRSMNEGPSGTIGPDTLKLLRRRSEELTG